MNAGTPGLVTRQDMERLEQRVDELLELVDELENKLAREEQSP